MKKFLIVPFSLIISLIFQQDILAQNPTCEEQYETWLMMRSCNEICNFSSDIKDFIFKYAQQIKFTNNSYCDSILTNKKREDIGLKVLPVIKNGYLNFKNDVGQKGHKLFCDTMEKIILDLKNENSLQ